MKKIKTLFKRDFSNNGQINNQWPLFGCQHQNGYPHFIPEYSAGTGWERQAIEEGWVSGRKA